MLEMLMLLGTGLFAAGVAGMTGIASQPLHQAGETVRPEDVASVPAMTEGFAAGEDDELLDEVRRIGAVMDVAGVQLAPDIDTLDDLLAGAGEDSGETIEVSVPATDTPATQPAADTSTDTTSALDVIAAVEDAVSGTSVKDLGAEPALAAHVEVTAGSDDEDSPTFIGDMAALGEGAEDEGPAMIMDFSFGAEKLSLLLPDDMGVDTQLRIEAAGEDGADAALVLEDALGSLTAAVIKGGFGSVTPDDIEFEYAA